MRFWGVYEIFYGVNGLNGLVGLNASISPSYGKVMILFWIDKIIWQFVAYRCIKSLLLLYIEFFSKSEVKNSFFFRIFA